MSRKHRAVMPETLRTPEEDLELEGRAQEVPGEEPVPEDKPAVPATDVPSEAPDEEDEPDDDDPEAGMRGRLKAMREALPIPPQGSCRACFQRGARATLTEIKDVGSLRAQLGVIRKAPPPDETPHSSADYKRGILAILDGVGG